MNVLCVGAHADDLELCMGGTIARMVEDGDEVYLLHMVNTGYDDPVEERVVRSKKQTYEYAFKAAEVLGVSHKNVLWGDYEDRRVPFKDKTVIHLDRIIRGYSVEAVYTHGLGSSHQDHQRTHYSVMAAARRVSNIYLFEQVPLLRATLHPIVPNLYVDITDQLKRKVEAVKAYELPHGDIIENLVGLAKFRGGQCGVRYAEAFQTVKEVR